MHVHVWLGKYVDKEHQNWIKGITILKAIIFQLKKEKYYVRTENVKQN